MSIALPPPGEARSRVRPGERVLDLVERPLGDLEPAYRQHFLQADVEQAILGMSMMAIPMVLFAFCDYLLVGASQMLALLTFVRLLFLALSLGAIWRLRRASTAQEYDRAINIWAVLAIVTAFTLNAIRPPSYTLQLGIQTLALMTIYLVIPSRLSTRLTMAAIVLVMVAAMQLSGRRQVDLATTTLIWSTVSLTILIGLTLSARFQSSRRRQFLDRLEIERTRDELHAIASTDALTGLLSRRRLLELAEQDLGRALRYQRRLSLIAIDLDHFKQVNDRYGHSAGDGVLIAVADVLREQARQHDLVGRMGGEEFAIVLPETGLEAAHALAQRIRERVSELLPVVDGVAIPVTISLGVAEASPGDGTIQEPLKRADRALYRAKDNGRDRVAAA
jgi:diguanylate cyclase (GGDEF)-like protein